MIVTSEALEALNKVMEEQCSSSGPVGVVIGVKSGGCAGYEYTMDIVHNVDEDDLVAVIDGGFVYMTGKSSKLLENTTMDYEETVQSNGFVFSNPDATSTCGCGTSFSV